jgi:hypothetical protein
MNNMKSTGDEWMTLNEQIIYMCKFDSAVGSLFMTES